MKPWQFRAQRPWKWLVVAPPVLFLLVIAFQWPRVWTLDIGTGGDWLFLDGFFGAETSDSATMRWSSPDAQLRLAALPGQAVLLGLRLHGNSAERSEPGSAAVAVGWSDTTLLPLKLTPGWRVYRVSSRQHEATGSCPPHLCFS